MNSMNDIVVGGTTFIASAVEAVEALTIVLAVGYTRSWRTAVGAAVTALLVLALMVAIGGPLLIATIPIHVMSFVIGLLLLLYGLSWLRKAILRYSGRKALHDEDAIYAAEAAELAAPTKTHDHIAFFTAFNGVFLEGLEIVVIVLTIGVAQRHASLQWAAGGALAAVLLVICVGYLVRKPLARVPENAMKFVVGLMLTTFGTFWTGEGLGLVWPQGELSLAVIVVVLAITSYCAIVFARRNTVAA